MSKNPLNTKGRYPIINRPGRRAALIASLLGLLTFTGCGEETFDRVTVHPVEGKVILGNGSPEGAIVILHPEDTSLDTLRPSAKVAADGSFKITTYQNGDGAPAGTYKVTVQLYKLPAKPSEFKPGRNVLPAAYGSPKTSQLSVAVAEGTNEISPIHLK